MDTLNETYTADHQLSELLQAASRTGKPIRVEAEGRTYDIVVTPSVGQRLIWDDYDPEAIREALHALRGSLRDVDPDELIRQIKDERE